jgi:cellular nucleic acid-binding protein
LSAAVRRRRKSSRFIANFQPSLTRDGTSKMSSLARRACYKCGNVGHYAEVCSSSERLCYNCKQAGECGATCALEGDANGRDMNGHAHTHLRIRTGADEPVQATKATTARCPGPPRVSRQHLLPRDIHSAHTPPAKQCYHCQGLGHVQADCPTLRLSGAARGAGGQCYSCGQAGHLAVSHLNLLLPCNPSRD